MRAAVIDRYGPPEVVQVVEVPRPVPADGEVLIRVVAAAVTSGDARIRAARFPPGFALPARLAFGIRRPRRAVLGSSLSGIVETTAPGVDTFAPGDQVCAMTGTRMGAHAEYVAVPVGRLARKPTSVTHEDAAGLLFGGTAALYFLRDRASFAPGSSVLVNGASGAVGTNAVQLAHHLGATVTAVTSAANAELVTDLGAERVIDHQQTDITALTERFDVVLDTVGKAATADLLIVGAPTHFFGLPSRRSRRLWTRSYQPVRGSGTSGPALEPDAEGPGVREWLDGMGPVGRDRLAAAFDTRLRRAASGAAARRIARRLRRAGYRLAVPPAGFFVDDMTGPLGRGELERARTWGAALIGQQVA
jgi:NADPH:quinone reductase-like Zn-dependent oxidoreductase